MAIPGDMAKPTGHGGFPTNACQRSSRLFASFPSKEARTASSSSLIAARSDRSSAMSSRNAAVATCCPFLVSWTSRLRASWTLGLRSISPAFSRRARRLVSPPDETMSDLNSSVGRMMYGWPDRSRVARTSNSPASTPYLANTASMAGRTRRVTCRARPSTAIPIVSTSGSSRCHCARRASIPSRCGCACANRVSRNYRVIEVY